jgi:hypothetical protein
MPEWTLQSSIFSGPSLLYLNEEGTLICLNNL